MRLHLKHLAAPMWLPQIMRPQIMRTVDLRQTHLQKVDPREPERLVAEKIAAIADAVPLTRTAAGAIEITTAAAATEAAAADSDNKAVAGETSRVVAAITDQEARANVVDQDLTTHHQWKNRWKRSLPLQTKN